MGAHTDDEGAYSVEKLYDDDKTYLEGLPEEFRRHLATVFAEVDVYIENRKVNDYVKRLQREMYGYLHQIEVQDAEITCLRERLGLPPATEVADE
jgi:hypothetical protein